MANLARFSKRALISQALCATPTSFTIDGTHFCDRGGRINNPIAESCEVGLLRAKEDSPVGTVGP
ncbi:hypothetical protein E2542_SST21865 [Spatholobus suberectus]|nr:hypothetical protein E2542_SST21865 [Spatholobus suberectus]